MRWAPRDPRVPRAPWAPGPHHKRRNPANNPRRHPCSLETQNERDQTRLNPRRHPCSGTMGTQGFPVSPGTPGHYHQKRNLANDPRKHPSRPTGLFHFFNSSILHFFNFSILKLFQFFNFSILDLLYEIDFQFSVQSFQF